MKKVIIILLILAVIAVVIVGSIMLKRRASGVTAVTMEPVAKRDIVQIVTAFGRLNPEVNVDISAKVIGQIEVLHVEEGDTIAKGDTLVELEKNRYTAAVSSAQAALRSARSDVSRVRANLKQARETLRKTQTMFDKNLASEDALLQAQTQMEVQEAMLESAINNVDRSKGTLDETLDDLARTTIIAPVHGVVVSLSAEEGENVITGTMNNPASVIMSIAQLDAMEAVVDVDEADVVNVEIGQTARIEVDAFPDTFLIGEVVKIGNTANLQSVGGQETVANFEIKISVPEPFKGIRPGMSCTAEIEVDKVDSALSVPIQCIVAAKETAQSRGKPAEGGRSKSPEGGPSGTRNGIPKKKDAVFTVKNGITHQKLVETGIADDRYIEIKSGLQEGEIVVTGRYEALRNLEDGDRVEPIKDEMQGMPFRKGGFNAKFK